jgi:NitT/TauT family transport system ATP-binding protein
MGVELLRIWERTRKTVLLVTHSIAEAVLLSDTVITFTPRPGRVRAVHRIDLPRPRTQETRLSPGFIEYSRVLLKELEGDPPREDGAVPGLRREPGRPREDGAVPPREDGVA